MNDRTLGVQGTYPQPTIALSLPKIRFRSSFEALTFGVPIHWERCIFRKLLKCLHKIFFQNGGTQKSLRQCGHMGAKYCILLTSDAWFFFEVIMEMLTFFITPLLWTCFLLVCFRGLIKPHLSGHGLSMVTNSGKSGLLSIASISCPFPLDRLRSATTIAVITQHINNHEATMTQAPSSCPTRIMTKFLVDGPSRGYNLLSKTKSLVDFGDLVNQVLFLVTNQLMVSYQQISDAAAAAVPAIGVSPAVFPMLGVEFMPDATQCTNTCTNWVPRFRVLSQFPNDFGMVGGLIFLKGVETTNQITMTGMMLYNGISISFNGSD